MGRSLVVVLMLWGSAGCVCVQSVITTAKQQRRFYACRNCDTTGSTHYFYYSGATSYCMLEGCVCTLLLGWLHI